MPFEDFTKNAASSNGFGGYCKKCATAMEADKRETAAAAWAHVQPCSCRICVARIVAKSELKRCSNCKCQKEHGDFAMSLGAIDGLQSWCKECLAEYQRIEGRWTTRKRKYGLDKESFWARYNDQNGLCLACDEPLAEVDVCVDHNHRCCAETPTCGECIRGFLYRTCNTALGLIGDSPDRAMALAAYLLRFEDVLSNSNYEGGQP